MSESPQEFSLRAEIADLNQQIEAKKMELEASRGINIEHKEALKEVVSERVYTGAPPATQSTTQAKSAKVSDDDHYLNTLDEVSTDKVNNLIEKVASIGIKKAVEEAKLSEPFILDAFHDALVDRLYDELKEHGHIK